MGLVEGCFVERAGLLLVERVGLHLDEHVGLHLGDVFLNAFLNVKRFATLPFEHNAGKAKEPIISNSLSLARCAILTAPEGSGKVWKA